MVRFPRVCLRNCPFLQDGRGRALFVNVVARLRVQMGPSTVASDPLTGFVHVPVKVIGVLLLIVVFLYLAKMGDDVVSYHFSRFVGGNLLYAGRE